MHYFHILRQNKIKKSELTIVAKCFSCENFLQLNDIGMIQFLP